MARLSFESIPALDGYRVATNFYEPFHRTNVGEVAVINAGAGIPKSLYEPFATWLAENGLPTVTYDYRGIGDSRGRSIRGLTASIQDWGSKDCAGILRGVQLRFPGAKICLIGHSIGGVVTGFVSNPPEIARMLFISPHTGYWRDYDPASRAKMYLLWHFLMPIMTRLVGYFPGRWFGLPEDLPYEFAMEWGLRSGENDRRVRFFGADARTRAQTLQQLGFERFSRFNAAVLTIRPSDDPFATEAGMRHVASLFRNCSFSDFVVDVASREDTRLGHFGFFHRANRDGLWRRALTWLTG